MTANRIVEVLSKGFNTAKERMLSDKGLKAPEYKRDFQKLYGDAENELFDVYNAIEDKKYKELLEKASNLIITMSEIIELTEVRLEAEKKKWNWRQELD